MMINPYIFTPTSTLNVGIVSVYNAESNTTDSFGTNNGTAIGGLTYSTGKIGQAFQFNGSNAFVRLPNNAFNSLTGDFSVSAWVYIPSGYLGADAIHILQNMGCDSWFTNPYGWRFFTSGNHLFFQIFNHTNTYYAISYGYMFTTNTWYHVAMTRKGSTGSKLYLNGNLVASDSNTVNPLFYANDITPTIGNLYMGTNGSKQNDYFAPNGSKVDAMTVWDRELTASNITELYNAGTGKQYPF